MKLEEYKKLTEEERLNLFNELEEEKIFLSKALEKFINAMKNNESQEKEKWISLSGWSGGAIRVSDIEYIEATAAGALVVTKKIRYGENLSFKCDDSPEEIVKKINGE